MKLASRWHLAAVLGTLVLAAACGSSTDDVGVSPGAQSGEGSGAGGVGGSGGGDSSSEAGSMDAAVPSDGASSGDASTASCVAPVGGHVSSKTARKDWGCKQDQAEAWVVSVTEPTNITLFYNHTTNWDGATSLQLRRGCGPDSVKLAEHRYDHRTESYVLQSGIYTLVQCNFSSFDRGRWRLDPVATPPNTNTSCATAKEITTSGFTQPYRQFDASKIYFKFRTPPPPSAPWSPSIRGLSAQAQPGAVVGRMAAGSFHVQVQTVCDDPSTALVDIDGTFSTPYNGTRFSLNNLVAGAMYWIVFSAIDPGIDLRVDFSSSLTSP